PGPEWGQIRGWRRLRLRPGATVPLVEQVGPGTIRGMYLRLPRDLTQARRLVLRAYWDGEAEPSIEAPLLDLFGSGWLRTEIDVATLPVGRSNEGWYFRLPMPFRRSARLTLENESERTVELRAAVELAPGDPDSGPHPLSPSPNAGGGGTKEGAAAVLPF